MPRRRPPHLYVPAQNSLLGILLAVCSIRSRFTGAMARITASTARRSIMRRLSSSAEKVWAPADINELANTSASIVLMATSLAD